MNGYDQYMQQMDQGGLELGEDPMIALQREAAARGIPIEALIAEREGTVIAQHAREREQGLSNRARTRAEALRDEKLRPGIHTGATFVAANPLNAIATVLANRRGKKQLSELDEAEKANAARYQKSDQTVSGIVGADAALRRKEALEASKRDAAQRMAEIQAWRGNAGTPAAPANAPPVTPANDVAIGSAGVGQPPPQINPPVAQPPPQIDPPVAQRPPQINPQVAVAQPPAIRGAHSSRQPIIDFLRGQFRTPNQPASLRGY